MHPGLFGAAAGWSSGRQFKETCSRLSEVAVGCTYVRDQGEGEVVIDDEGQPRVHYKMAKKDRSEMLKVTATWSGSPGCTTAW